MRVKKTDLLRHYLCVKDASVTKDRRQLAKPRCQAKHLMHFFDVRKRKTKARPFCLVISNHFAETVLSSASVMGFARKGRSFQGFKLCRVDESALTGESEDVIKNTNSDRFLRSGSRVLEGQGRLLVTAVGSNSQQGQIFGSLTDPTDSLRCSPLQLQRSTFMVTERSFPSADLGSFKKSYCKILIYSPFYDLQV